MEALEEKIFTASQWRLIWYRFRRHKLALLGSAILAVMYLMAAFAPFISPYQPTQKFDEYLYAPPSKLHFRDESGRLSLVPHIYGVKKYIDMNTLATKYVPDYAVRYQVRFFVKGWPYRLLGTLHADVHLFGVDPPARIFLFGTDELGHDLFSRVIHAAQISLSIGLVGIAISFILGCIIGGLAGYYGGWFDMASQRAIEFLISIPTLPLWMALSAALPRNWSQIRVYFAITVILSLTGWTGLARVVRGKLLSTRTEAFVEAAELAGASTAYILRRHLLPTFISYLIVHVTLSIPSMILGETALSFLGLGLRPPVVSWGVLLNAAQNVRTIALYPWLMLPVPFVVATVLAFNFVGDGLRDAADPYK